MITLSASAVAWLINMNALLLIALGLLAWGWIRSASKNRDQNDHCVVCQTEASAAIRRIHEFLEPPLRPWNIQHAREIAGKFIARFPRAPLP
jgi:hypothetical protein